MPLKENDMTEAGSLVAHGMAESTVTTAIQRIQAVYMPGASLFSAFKECDNALDALVGIASKCDLDDKHMNKMFKAIRDEAGPG